MGGLSRQATAIKEKQKQVPHGNVVINTGNNVTGPSNQISLLKLDLMLRSFELMDVAMIGVGPGELGLDKKDLQNISKAVKIPLVCANVRETDEGPALFQPWVSLVRGGKRIVVTSVVDPSAIKEKTDVQLTDPVQALETVARSAPHDLLVAVIHANGERSRTIVEAAPVAQVVLLGFSLPWSIGNVETLPVVVSNIAKGQSMAWLDMTWDGKPVNNVKRGRLFLTDDVVAVDPAIEKMIEEYKIKVKGFEELDQMLMESRSWKMLGQQSYAGVASCRFCHVKQYESWATTQHARAFVNVAKETNQECFTCHVTGRSASKAMNGFLSMDRTPEKANVQCEACHGPGGWHALEPRKNPLASPTENDCRTCHTPKWSPNFDFMTYKARGVHS